MNPFTFFTSSKEDGPSLSTIFIGFFVLVFGVFVYSGSDTILEGFGYETKSTLANKVGVLKSDVQRMGDVNRSLMLEVEEQKRILAVTYKELDKLRADRVEIYEDVDDIKTKRDKVTIEVVGALKGLKDGAGVNSPEYTKMVDVISVEVIDSINDVYEATRPINEDNDHSSATPIAVDGGLVGVDDVVFLDEELLNS